VRASGRSTRLLARARQISNAHARGRRWRSRLRTASGERAGDGIQEELASRPDLAVADRLVLSMALTSWAFFIFERPLMSSRLATSMRWAFMAKASTPPAVRPFPRSAAFPRLASWLSLLLVECHSGTGTHPRHGSCAGSRSGRSGAAPARCSRDGTRNLTSRAHRRRRSAQRR
jgi:hypothetical protein